MKSFYPLSDHVGSLSTKATKACTHGFRTASASRGEGNTLAIPTKSRVGYPTSLSAGRSNPYSRPASAMNNCESPLSFDIQNFTVWNQLSAKWINNFDTLITEYKFRLNPDGISNTTQKQSESKLEDGLSWVAKGRKTVDHKEEQQSKRCSSPDEITSRPEGFVHLPSIAGDRT